MIESFGGKASEATRIRLGHGVVGNTSHVAMVMMLALAVIAYGIVSLDGSVWLLAAMALLVVLSFFGFFGWILWFANKHPNHAMAGGAELVQLRHLEMAAKGLPTIPPNLLPGSEPPDAP